MITASHNKASDNGVKIVDYNGELLDSLWEKKATYFVNAEDPGAAFMTLLEAQDEGEEPIYLSNKGCVFVARDTRPSSIDLSEALIKGVRSAGGDEIDLGLLTTPQLHFLVQQSYRSGSLEVSLNDYYQHLKEKTELFKACVETEKKRKY